MSTRRHPHREPSIGERRSALSRALAENAELRASAAGALAENARLRERVAELERRGSKSSGSGGSGGADPFEVLRKNTQAARDAKARRTAACAHAEQVVSGVRKRGRGKRAPRPAMPVDRELRLEVPAEQLPADARPNGWVSRRFQGLGLVRNNVLMLRREYLSPTEGRVVAEIPPGWRAEFTPELRATLVQLHAHGVTEG